MKVLIFGATGSTGRPLVAQALKADMEVIAFARTPANVPMNNHPNLTIIQGDATHPDDIKQAITPDLDTVVTVMGQRPNESNPHLLENAITPILESMREQNIRRIIAMSGAAAWIKDKDQPRLLEHAVRLVMKTVAGKVLADSSKMVEIVMDSGLDWTIPRAPRMVEGQHTGTYRVGYLGQNAGTTISYADMADFIVKLLQSDDYYCEAPVVSY